MKPFIFFFGQALTTAAGTGTGNGNTFPGVFDPDRFIFFGVNVSL